MNIKHLHGVALFTAGVASLLVGCAFYFLIIGVFEMIAATISLVAFIVLAAVVWTKPDKESSGRGPQACGCIAVVRTEVGDQVISRAAQSISAVATRVASYSPWASLYWLVSGKFLGANGPERPDFRMKFYAEMDDLTPIDSFLASSSSGREKGGLWSREKIPRLMTLLRIRD